MRFLRQCSSPNDKLLLMLIVMKEQLWFSPVKSGGITPKPAQFQLFRLTDVCLDAFFVCLFV